VKKSATLAFFASPKWKDTNMTGNDASSRESICSDHVKCALIELDKHAGLASSKPSILITLRYYVATKRDILGSLPQDAIVTIRIITF